MEVKNFIELTYDRKRHILLEWWNRFGMREDTTVELDEFKRILNDDLEFAWNMMLVSRALNEGNHRFVLAIRDDSMDIYKKFINRVVSCNNLLEVFANTNFC